MLSPYYTTEYIISRYEILFPRVSNDGIDDFDRKLKILRKLPPYFFPKAFSAVFEPNI